MDDGCIPSPDMWLFIFSQVGDSDGAGLVRGQFAEFVKDCPHRVIAWVVQIYEEAITNLRYTNADDVFGFRELLVCPITSLGIKPIDVGTATIDALESVWERYVGTSYGREDDVPHFNVMMARLLRITLHLEWAGYGGFATFSRKWEQLKSWRRGEYIDPLAGQIMDYFVLPPSWMGGFSSDILPLEMRKKLYMEMGELYTTNVLDPTFWEEEDKRDSLLKLSQTVLADEGVDESFKVPFRRHAGDQVDGHEAREAGDT